MSFLLKSKPKGTSRLKIYSVIVLFVLLFLLSFMFPQGMKSVAYFSSKPIWSAREVISNSFSNIISFFSSKNALIKKNLSLEDQLTSYKLREIDYDMVLKQNEELKMLNGRLDKTERVMARILSKPPFSPYDTMVIDAGSNVGLVKNNLVYLSGNIIIGFLSEVTTNTSLVTLFSSGDQKQEAVNLRTGTTFEISGKGGANFQVEVPKETDIVWGDVFEYPSLTPSVMGSVYYIDTNSQSSFKTIHIRVPGNEFESKWVFVEKNKIDN